MSKARILIVEDEAIVAHDIQESLVHAGYEVSAIVSSGEEAIAKAEASKPNLALMDIMLGGKMDGITAATELRERLNVPVVYLTSHADKATLDRAKITEPYGYILKPFKEMELRTVVELALHRYESDRKRAEEGAGERRAPAPIPDFTKLVERPRTHSEIDKRNIVSFLQRVEPFKQLPSEVVEATSEVCYFARFAAGEVISLEGDAECPGFVVVSGRVALVKTSTSGKELIVDLLPPLDSFGLLTTLEKGPRALTAKAQVHSGILRVPRPVMTYIFDNYPELSRDFIHKILERLRKAHDLSRALAHDSVEVRIAATLLAVVPRFSSNGVEGETRELEMTRQELADLTGTAPETVSRVVKSLERQELLDLSEAGIVRVVDMKGLEQVAML